MVLCSSSYCGKAIVLFQNACAPWALMVKSSWKSQFVCDAVVVAVTRAPVLPADLIELGWPELSTAKTLGHGCWPPAHAPTTPPGLQISSERATNDR